MKQNNKLAPRNRGPPDSKAPNLVKILYQSECIDAGIFKEVFVDRELPHPPRSLTPWYFRSTEEIPLSTALMDIIRDAAAEMLYFKECIPKKRLREFQKGILDRNLQYFLPGGVWRPIIFSKNLKQMCQEARIYKLSHDLAVGTKRGEYPEELDLIELLSGKIGYDLVGMVPDEIPQEHQEAILRRMVEAYRQGASDLTDAYEFSETTVLNNAAKADKEILQLYPKPDGKNR